MEQFRIDNTAGYTQEQLDKMNELLMEIVQNFASDPAYYPDFVINTCTKICNGHYDEILGFNA